MGPSGVIVLDTNVVSELAKPEADARVVAWADAQSIFDLYTTAISEAEILYGLSIMPTGRRRDALQQAMAAAFSALLSGRVLPFDRMAARWYATLACEYRQRGRPVGRPDLQIAAIARARNADAIATRNLRDFADCGVPLVNPWAP
jgi:toxin FitB